MNQDATNPRPVDVVGRFEIASSAGRVEVEGLGRYVIVRLPRLSLAFAAMRSVLRLERKRRVELLTRLRSALRRADVELRFHIDRREIARVGGPGRTGLAARGLGLPGFRVRAMARVPGASPTVRERR